MSDLQPGISVHHMVLNPPIDRLALLNLYLRPYVNEFVIVDTGSSESDIAKMLSWSTPEVPVTVISEPFVDFSTSRNKGLPLHRYAWTLALDPDELPSVEMLKHMLWATTVGETEYPNTLGWLYWTYNFWGGVIGEEMDYHWHCRLWRTDRGEYYRPVHELIRLDGKEEAATRGSIVLQAAPKNAYLIHSKPEHEIAKADALYNSLGEVSK